MERTNDQEKYEIVKFVDNGFELEVNVSPAENTVWLTQEQMTALFDVDQSRISRHLNAAIKDGELSKESNMRKTHITGSFKRNGQKCLAFLLRSCPNGITKISLCH